MQLLDELTQAGWDPFDPSDECRTATKLPSMPGWLRDIDRLGIYYDYLVLVLYSRFARGTRDGDLRRHQLTRIAVLFALQKSNLRNELTPAVAEEWLERIEAWRRATLVPADERMSAADHDEVMRNPRDFEPAFTLAYLTVNLGIVDVERDRELMSLGRAMHEEDSNRPRLKVPTTDEELRGFHAWLTEGGNTIARITDEGKFEIDPLLVKSWSESKLGRLIQPEGARLSEPQGPEKDLEEIVDALAAVEQVQRVHRIRDERLTKSVEGSARWHVLQTFFELAQGELTFRALSDRVGLSPSALQEAFAVERTEISRALKVA